MLITGISYTKGDNGKRSTTLHGLCPFDAYQDNPDAGRFCEGQKAESVYVGGYDCTDLKVGDEVEIYYGKAITTAKGTFQPVAMIRVISE